MNYGYGLKSQYSRSDCCLLEEPTARNDWMRSVDRRRRRRVGWIHSLFWDFPERIVLFNFIISLSYGWNNEIEHYAKAAYHAAHPFPRNNRLIFLAGLRSVTKCTDPSPLALPSADDDVCS